MDPILLSAMIAGASTLAPEIGKIVGTEVIKEVTKDAYKSLKSVLVSVCGKKVDRAAQRLEDDPSSTSAQEELASAVSDIPAEDAEEVSEKLTALLNALNEDKVAAKVAETIASIKLDIDSGGHVTLDRIKGADEINVKSRSTGDFRLTNVEMGRDKLGN